MTSATREAAETAYGIRAADRVCDILDLLGSRVGNVSLGEIAAACDLPKSSAYRYLSTLEARRYVEREPVSGEYRLGLGLLPLQANHVNRLVQRARPHLERLRDHFGETANLGVLDGTRITYLDIVESHRSMRLAARPGDRDHLHCTALGKAVAAQLPVERVEQVLRAEGLPRRTEHTITTLSRYLRELDAVRRQGYALDSGENEPDGRCVAVAVPGDLHAAVSVSAPLNRLALEDVPDVVTELKKVAEAVASG